MRRWIWSGRLPATKRGNVLYVDEEDLPAAGSTPRGNHDPASSRPSRRSRTLEDWGREVEAWRATTGPSKGSAADLVVEDRTTRGITAQADVDSS